MPMMTAAQYEESLRKLNLVVYMFGKQVENVVDDPIIRPSMLAVAKTYELAHDARHIDLMTARSHAHLTIDREPDVGEGGRWLSDRVDARCRFPTSTAYYDRPEGQHAGEGSSCHGHCAALIINDISDLLECNRMIFIPGWRC